MYENSVAVRYGETWLRIRESDSEEDCGVRSRWEEFNLHCC